MHALTDKHISRMGWWMDECKHGKGIDPRVFLESGAFLVNLQVDRGPDNSSKSIRSSELDISVISHRYANAV